jgi:class 3 adenylate cyclase/predicted ATPase
MDMGSWLRSLGFEKYEAIFRENAVDVGILHDLDEAHFREMGIPLGDRIKLLKAIKLLPPAETMSSSSTDARIDLRSDTAERRQVTVMFCDLVGSTALSVSMDPEDLRAIISAYQKCVAETVDRFGGFVAKYMGDGVLVYFGYPQAHEHDAEQAARAGLEIVAAVNSLRSSVPLQARVGIATGVVVVGDLVGSGASQERGIVGETPNLAARLQSIAEPNMVVIADGTRKLLGNLFELENIGPTELKGIDGPVQPWAVLRPSSAESRFEALHASGLTALVGREEELELLQRRWSRAKNGNGQLVLLSGEAGIGKSRLTAALLEILAPDPHIRLRYFCSPQHTGSALYPIISQMERAAGISPGDAPQARLDKLDAALAQSSVSEPHAALFAGMLSLPNDGRYPALELDAQQRRQRLLKALTSRVESLAAENPVLMIFEDVHWIDPTSLEVLGRVLQSIQSLRVLLLVTFRPEFEPPWIGGPHVTALTINRLAQVDIDLMIDRVVGNKLIAERVRQDIIERTDGIPLFVEEMTKAILEAGSDNAAEHIAAAIPSPTSAVPASLHAALMARLDRLGSAKELAQLGAVIGREFSHTLLSSVAHMPEAQLRSAIDRLVEAGLLFQHGVAPNATYLFKHALVQDAAYGTLLREPRRALHARIAQTLEEQFAEVAESQPELLARHYAEAGLIESAAGFWGKAGQRSLARSALAEAADQLSHALGQIAELPSTPARRGEEIRLHLMIVNVLMHVKGYAAPETRVSLDRARSMIEHAEALGDPLDDPLLLFSVLYGLWVANYNAFDGNAVCELAAQFLRAAEKQGATVPIMVGRRLTGISLFHIGDLVKGRAQLDYAMRLYVPAEHRSLAMRFGQDVGVGIRFQRSLPLWMLGYPDAALADSGEAISMAREIGQATTLMPALLYTSITHILCGNYAMAIEQSNELVVLAEEKGGALWKAFGVLSQGTVLALTGMSSDAVQTIKSGIGALQSTGSTLWMSFWLSHLAKSYAELGQSIDAGRCINEALVAIEDTKERLYEAEINRVAGEIALLGHRSNTVKAEGLFERALSLARAQQAKSWELRAATSMARLWNDQGKRDEARDLLAPIHGWFTEGSNTLDLRDTKALLNTLAVA